MQSLPEQPLLHHLRIRESIHSLLKPISLEHVNRVPEGFNNNLVWNAGHIIASHELLVYALTGNQTPSGKAFIDTYRRGTRPEKPVSGEEYAYIKEELLAGNRRLRERADELDWSNFRTFETLIGITLYDLPEALVFNNHHEMLHLGTMLALRKLV